MALPEGAGPRLGRPGTTQGQEGRSLSFFLAPPHLGCTGVGLGGGTGPCCRSTRPPGQTGASSLGRKALSSLQCLRTEQCVCPAPSGHSRQRSRAPGSEDSHALQEERPQVCLRCPRRGGKLGPTCPFPAASCPPPQTLSPCAPPRGRAALPPVLLMCPGPTFNPQLDWGGG